MKPKVCQASRASHPCDNTTTQALGLPLRAGRQARPPSSAAVRLVGLRKHGITGLEAGPTETPSSEAGEEPGCSSRGHNRLHRKDIKAATGPAQLSTQRQFPGGRTSCVSLASSLPRLGSGSLGSEADNPDTTETINPLALSQTLG